MEHTSKYYEDKIAEHNSRAQTIAQSLNRAAINGEITFTEAWYSLPAPTPHVNSEFIASTMIHKVTYPHLPDGVATAMKTRMDQEFVEAMTQREHVYNQSRMTTENRERELKDSVENTRKAYDSSVIYPNDLKNRIEVMREQLIALERAYENAKKEMERARESKERAEKEQVEYMSAKHSREMEDKATAEARINTLAGFRDKGVVAQKKENDEWHSLWNNLQTAKKEELEMAKRVQLQKQEEYRRAAEQHEFERRIEEEAAKRMKDSEFELLVQKKMAQMGRASVVIKL